MLTRRGFLVGATGLLTSAFVADAKTFIRLNDEPLLASPAQISETLCWYDAADQGYTLTIGPWTFCPPPPTWREFFVGEGIGHRTEPEMRAIWEKHKIGPEDYDDPVGGWFWETHWDLKISPPARAYRLLESLDLGPELAGRANRTYLQFNEGDVGNLDSRWVDAKDKLALSLLQARLIDLGRPIRIVGGS